MLCLLNLYKGETAKYRNMIKWEDLFICTHLFLSLQKNEGNSIHFVQKYYLKKKKIQEGGRYLKQFEII